MSVEQDRRTSALGPDASTSDHVAASSTDAVSRRAALALAAAGVATAAGASWRWRLQPGGVLALRQESAAGASAYVPELFTHHELEAVARLVEGIIPRTDTAGARDAQVHEYIDLALSVGEQAERERFMAGLRWVDARSRSRFALPVHEADATQIASLLAEIGDQREEHPEEPPEELATGRSFFADLKPRTVFGYYTSQRGRAEELGRPDAVTIERFRGCTHREG